MLDDLLGRTALQERIAELEETLKRREAERDRLEQQLEAERDRRSDAVTERQAAQRRVNKLEDRITQLEDQLDRLQSDSTELSVRRETTLRGDRLTAVLDRLASFETGPEGALTAAVADGRDLPAAVGETLGDRAGLVSRAAPCIVVADDASLVSACLRPPVQPAPFVEWGSRFRLDREWFQPYGQYTLAVVRSDLFAMGTYQADERTAFHGFDGDIRTQHSKGGFSQARFERLRDEQIDSHLDRCRAALADRAADRLYLVGEGSVLGALADLEPAVTTTVDATDAPEVALETAFDAFWRVQLRIL